MPAKTAPKKKLSALKRARQSEKKRLRNQSIKTKIKTQISKLNTALHSKNMEDAAAILKDAQKVISSAASKNVIHKNAASRKISRITKKVNALKSKESILTSSTQAEES